MIEVSYIIKRKIKKIFLELISNSKIFNIIFFNEIIKDLNFPKLTGGLDKGGGTGQRRIRYINAIKIRSILNAIFFPENLIIFNFTATNNHLLKALIFYWN